MNARGEDDPEELLSRVKDGIFAKSFGGGQVDIVSGKFVFSCTEAYRVKNGKLGDPIKGATLIGDGPTALTKVVGIGNDWALDEGIGMCGKGGQSVPAGVGQPTLLLEGLTVGGTAKPIRCFPRLIARALNRFLIIVALLVVQLYGVSS